MPSTRSALRPCCLPTGPGQARVPDERLCLSRSGVPHGVLQRPGPPTRPRAGLRTHPAPFLTTACLQDRASPPAIPGLSSGGAASGLLPAPQPSPEGSSRVPGRVTSESPDSGSLTKPARGPTPYLNGSLQRGLHACHMSANNNKLSSTSPPRVPVPSPRPGPGRRPTPEGSKGVPEGSEPG